MSLTNATAHFVKQANTSMNLLIFIRTRTLFLWLFSFSLISSLVRTVLSSSSSFLICHTNIYFHFRMEFRCHRLNSLPQNEKKRRETTTRKQRKISSKIDSSSFLFDSRLIQFARFRINTRVTTARRWQQRINDIDGWRKTSKDQANFVDIWISNWLIAQKSNWCNAILMLISSVGFVVFCVNCKKEWKHRFKINCAFWFLCHFLLIFFLFSVFVHDFQIDRHFLLHYFRTFAHLMLDDVICCWFCCLQKVKIESKSKNWLNVEKRWQQIVEFGAKLILFSMKLSWGSISLIRAYSFFRSSFVDSQDKFRLTHCLISTRWRWRRRQIETNHSTGK